MANVCFFYKQVILVRNDLKLSKGKLAVQVAHASVEAVLKSDKEALNCWKGEGSKKVVLEVANEKELIKFNQLAKDEGFKTALIKDAGRTEIEPGTVTALAIGPEEESKLDKLTGKLKML